MKFPVTEIASERKRAGAGTGIPSGKNALGIEARGKFHGLDVLVNQLVH